MSQVLKEMPTWAEDVDALGRPAKYPWRDWLDGETHLLIRTTDEYEGDYQTESRFFRHTVIRAAEKRNIEVFVAVHSDFVALRVRVLVGSHEHERPTRIRSFFDQLKYLCTVKLEACVLKPVGKHDQELIFFRLVLLRTVRHTTVGSLDEFAQCIM